MRIIAVTARRPASPGRMAWGGLPFETASPEEYSERFAHLWWCCSLPDYRYSEPELDEWLQQFAEIVHGSRVLRCSRGG